MKNQTVELTTLLKGKSSSSPNDDNKNNDEETTVVINKDEEEDPRINKPGNNNRNNNNNNNNNQDSPGLMAEPTLPVATKVSKDEKKNKKARYQEKTTNNKRGQIFCGCCCDMRRAAIILNLLAAFGNLCSAVLAPLLIYELADDYDNDVVTGGIVLVAEAFIVAFLLVHLNGAYGAARYEKRPVLVAGYADALVALGLVSVNPGVFVVGIIHTYANFGLYDELNKGIITEQNYHLDEEQSCCCV